MALQIRRGTSTEVISNQFVPAEGELIYTTDTKRVFVGDGFTIGGVDITSSSGTGGALTTNLDLNNQNITGIGDISINGLIVTDSEFRGDLRGNVIGDLAGNVVGTVTGELEGSVFGAGSTLLVDGDNNLIVGDVSGSIINEDGEYVLDNRASSTPMFYGSVSGDVIGNLYGDIYGNVVGIDSLLMVDATNTVLRVRDIEISENNIDAGSESLNILSNNLKPLEIYTATPGGFAGSIPFVHVNTSRGTTDSPTSLVAGDVVGGIGFRGYSSTTNNYKIFGGSIWGGLPPTANLSDTTNQCAIFVSTGGGGESKVNYFVFSEQNSLSSRAFHAAYFNNGTYTNFADGAARDSIITNPSPGMITYVENNGSGSPKFQGYVSDTGGGSPGWIDLH